ncbi:MAG: DUF4134 domain-containing protein [Cyclobacteriaceae bacterium]|nr:DUF4134 domain-containing protein [Cyclobacteriaceae bacterium]
MELSTLVLWNGTIYLLYYSLNLSFDYYRYRGNKKVDSVTYQVHDLLQEPVVFVKVPESPASTPVQKTIANSITTTETITFTAPVEDQGIPFPEFMANARQFSSAGRILTRITKLFKSQQMKKATSLLLLTFAATRLVFAQGALGIDAASSELVTYVDPVANMILILGAIVGLIGGIRVYIKWNSGDQDVQKSIMGWFGSCLFLILVGVVIKAFFGL